MLDRLLVALCLIILLVPASANAAGPNAAGSGHYLFVWTGDQAKQGNDFLSVIDADPGSPRYGKLVTTLATDIKSVRIHHTEYEMPASGMLFANDHDAGRTVVLDVRDPLHPRVAAEFGDLGGFSRPHSFLRLPNGHVLASFQHVSGATDHGAMKMGGGGWSRSTIPVRWCERAAMSTRLFPTR